MPYIGNNHIAGDHTNNFKVLDDISSYTATFDGSATSVVDTSNNTIRVVEHRFIQGQRVTYTNGGGGNIGGLTTGTAYFVIFDSASTFKLATSASNAASNTAINLSAVGTGSSHTLNAAFDGVNTKFKITYNSGTGARFNNATQLNIAINNVLQKPNVNSSTFTEGFAIEDNHKIVFKIAPTSEDIFWGSIIANTLTTFDISDHKIDTFTGDGSTTEFTLSHTPANNESLMVTINGVLQHPSNASTARAYTLIASIIQFTAAPGVGDEIQVRHIGFAGATTADVSGFYGRTGNVVLTSNDHITTGNINAGIVTATSFDGTFSSSVGGSNANFTGIVTAGTFKGGNIDAVDGAFSGNVTIGGTLTYEDVTNIDSVGIVTAQTDVHVGAGLSVVGVSTLTDLTVEKSGNLNVNIKSTGGWGALEVGGSVAGYIDIKKPFSDDYDLRLMCDGNNNYITSNARPLKLSAQGAYGIELGAYGAPSLQYNNDTKLVTTSAGVSIPKDLDVDGHTNLDNVSIAGVTTSQTINFATNARANFASNNRLSIVSNATNSYLDYAGTLNVRASSGSSTALNFASNGNVNIPKDLDVDGHTNLDNASVAGVSTFSDQVIVGGGASRSLGWEHLLQIEHTNSTPHGISLIGNRANQYGPNLSFAKTRSSSLGGNTIVQDNDTLAQLVFRGADGVDLANISAMIGVVVDGTPAENNVPGAFEIYTGGLNKRLTIDSSGRVMIGNTNASTMFAGADDLVVGNTSGAHGITIITQNNSVGRLLFSDSTSSGAATYQGQINYNHSNNRLDLRTYTAGTITLSTSNTERIFLQSDGRFVIGNTTGTQPSATVAGAQFYGGSYPGDFRISSGAGASGTTTASIAIMGSNHNASIENGANSGAHLNLYNYNTTDGNSSGVMFMNSNGLSASRILGLNVSHSSRTGALVFMTSNGSHPTEKLRIDSSGRLLLGTTTEGDADADNLTIAGSGNVGMTIRSGTTSQGAIYFSDATSGNAEYDGFIVYNQSSRNLLFGTQQGTRMRIDSSGHMGLGVVPSAWPTNADYKAIQVGSGACIFGRGSGDEDRGGIGVNYYGTTSGAKYITNGHAARIYMADGHIYLQNAASNSSGADAAMTLNTRLQVDATDGHVDFTGSTSSTLGYVFQNATSGSSADTRVLVKSYANGGGDPYIKFDAGGQDMIVGTSYAGTTNNLLCLGPGSTPSINNNGFRINGLGKTLLSFTPTGQDAIIDLQNKRTRANGHLYGIDFRDSSNESNANIVIRQNSSGNNAAHMDFYTSPGTGGNGITNGTHTLRLKQGGDVAIPTGNIEFRDLSSSPSQAAPASINMGGTHSNAAGNGTNLNAKLKVWSDGTDMMGLSVSSNQLDYIVTQEVYDHVWYGGNSGTSELMRLEGDGDLIFTNGNKLNINASSAAGQYGALLNIGWDQGTNVATRAIDIGGGWSSGENKRITFSHSTGSNNLVGEINSIHYGGTPSRTSPHSGLRFGKLYHSNDSTTFTMTLDSTSTTTADLNLKGAYRSTKHPAFCAASYNNSSNLGSLTKMNYIISGTGSANNDGFDTTNNRFVAPVDGFYHFYARHWFTTGQNGTAWLYFFRNGSQVKECRLNITSTTSEYNTMQLSTTLYLSATNYIEVYAQGSGSNQFHPSGGTFHTEFSGFLVC